MDCDLINPKSIQSEEKFMQTFLAFGKDGWLTLSAYPSANVFVSCDLSDQGTLKIHFEQIEERKKIETYTYLLTDEEKHRIAPFWEKHNGNNIATPTGDTLIDATQVSENQNNSNSNEGISFSITNFCLVFSVAEKFKITIDNDEIVITSFNESNPLVDVLLPSEKLRFAIFLKKPEQNQFEVLALPQQVEGLPPQQQVEVLAPPQQVEGLPPQQVELLPPQQQVEVLAPQQVLAQEVLAQEVLAPWYFEELLLLPFEELLSLPFEELEPPAKRAKKN